MNLLRGFISILGSKVATLFLGLMITPVLVRLLGTAEYGDYAFLISILGITMIIVNAGIFDGTRKYIAEDRGDQNWVEQVFGFYARVALVLAGLAAVGFVILSYLDIPRRLFSSDFGLYFSLIGVLIIGRQAYSVVRGGLMGLDLEHRSEPLSILRKTTFAGFGLTLAYIG